MLVLSRRVDEVLVIGDDIHITILAVEKRCVRLGIVAPGSVRVDRYEVFLRRTGGKEPEPPPPPQDDPPNEPNGKGRRH